MTEIWWCAVYDRPELEADCSFKGVPLQGHKACGRMRLVPVDALVIVREADGQWPDWLIDLLGYETLDQLTEAAEENPQ